MAMAKRDVRPPHKESVKLQSSLSQPTTTNLTDHQQLSARRHLTLSISSNNNNNYSKETYPKQVDTSPSTSSAIESYTTQKTLSSSDSSMTHAELMQKWHEKKAYEISKKQKHRYTYGTPPSPTAYLTPTPSSVSRTHTLQNERVTERSRTLK